jgi:hypothetical protein
MSHGADGHGGGHGHVDLYGSHGGHSPSEHYGAHALVFFGGHGYMGSGGHVINTVSTAGAHYGTASHVDGIGSNQLDPKNVKLSDAQGVRLLVAHGLGLVDRGVGYYGHLLDQVARQVGLMRIDSRPGIKGEDSLGLDGILPWNTWGDMKSTEGPNGWLPGLTGMTDKIIHAYAIPHMGTLNGRRQLHVSPDEKVFILARMTVWHYAQTRDVEVKIEFIINHGYVYDRWHELYSFNGTRTNALEVKAFAFVKEGFARLTAKDDLANPATRKAYLEKVRKLPGWQNVGYEPGHEVGIHAGSAAEGAEVQAEDMRDIKQEDRTIENTVAAGASGTTTPPAPTPAEGFDDGENPDGDSMDGPIAVPDQVVAASPTPAATPPAAVPAPTAVIGTFNIPGNLKK